MDTLLGPEMKSTGEVMGIDKSYGAAFAKAQLGAKQNLVTSGTIFISVKDKDKEAALKIAIGFVNLGFNIMATSGASKFLEKKGIKNQMVNKVSIGRPHVVDAIKNNEIQLVINTPSDVETQKDGYKIRRATLKFNIPYTTTIAGANAILRAITALKKEDLSVKPLQEYHKKS